MPEADGDSVGLGVGVRVPLGVVELLGERVAEVEGV